MDDGLYRAAVPADALDSLVGRQLAEPIHAQQVLSLAQVSSRAGLAPDQVAIAIPVRPESAVDGRLKAGDAVQILVTVADRARNEVHARLVLERAQVFEVGREQTFGSTGSSGATTFTPAESDAASRGSIVTLTLVVSPDQALTLAEARRQGELDVLLLPPVEGARS
jgi:Flp pilus assembly protein CpaB